MINPFESLAPHLPWAFAQTYARSWPHDYVVRGSTIASEAYLTLARYLADEGQDEPFYGTVNRYLRHGGLLYWVSADGPAATDPTGVINRTLVDLSYPDRLAQGLLPEDEAWAQSWECFVVRGASGRFAWSPLARERLAERSAALAQ